MGKRDPRVDAYIARSAEFARPILRHIRAVVHEACPEVEETLKWSMPAFTYHGLLCTMAAFKRHCSFGFWKGALIVDRIGNQRVGMGDFDKITALSDLPSAAQLERYVKQAMVLNEQGVKVPRRKSAARKPVVVPDDLAAALARSPRARATFEKFSPSHRREYVEWITDAKRDDTRARRVAQAVEWLAAGKSRNWKYERG